MSGDKLIRIPVQHHQGLSGIWRGDDDKLASILFGWVSGHRIRLAGQCTHKAWLLVLRKAVFRCFQWGSLVSECKCSGPCQEEPVVWNREIQLILKVNVYPCSCVWANNQTDWNNPIATGINCWQLNWTKNSLTVPETHVIKLWLHSTSASSIAHWACPEVSLQDVTNLKCLRLGKINLFTQASLLVPLLHFVLQPLFVAFILACFHLPNAIGDLSLLGKLRLVAPQKIGPRKVGFIICLPAPSEAPAKVIRTKGWGLSKYHSTIALDTSKSLSTHVKILKGILGLLSSQPSEEINEIYKKYVIAILLSISPTG